MAQANEALQKQLQQALAAASKTPKAKSAAAPPAGSKSRSQVPNAKGKAKSKGRSTHMEVDEDDGEDEEEEQEEDEAEEQEDEEGEQESEEEEGLSEGAKLGRLRRLCERKPSGKLRVPEAIHTMWKSGGHSRQKLLKMLEDAGYEEDTVPDIHVRACKCI